MEQLFEGRTPIPEDLAGAVKINWWWVERSWRAAREAGLDMAQLVITGTRGIYPPRPRDNLVSTGSICWMDDDFRWCRCDDGWYRLGEFESEIPPEGLET